MIYMDKIYLVVDHDEQYDLFLNLFNKVVCKYNIIIP